MREVTNFEKVFDIATCLFLERKGITTKEDLKNYYLTHPFKLKYHWKNIGAKRYAAIELFLSDVPDKEKELILIQQQLDECARHVISAMVSCKKLTERYDNLSRIDMIKTYGEGTCQVVDAMNTMRKTLSNKISELVYISQKIDEEAYDIITSKEPEEKK